MQTFFKLITGLCDEMIDPGLPKSTEKGSALNQSTGLNAWLGGALQREPNDTDVAGDLTLRGPVTRWIGYVFGDPRMLPSIAQSKLPIEPGDPNPFFQIIDAVKREGGRVEVGDSWDAPAYIYGITREEWRQVGYAIAAVMAGGDVYGLPVWFEFDAEGDLDNDVPVTFPNATYSVPSDPEDPESEMVETNHTWRTWTRINPEQQGDKWYLESSDGSMHLEASAWVMPYLAGAINAPKSMSEYKKLQSHSSPSDP